MSMSLGLRWPRRLRLPEPLPPGSVLIEARRVSAELGGNPILNDVDLVARAGEVVALVGPNGAGKTTLLNVLTGDVAAKAGEVMMWGAPLGSWTPAELAVRRAVLPQQVVVSFPFLVDDIVRMGRSPWARTPEANQDDAAVAEALVQAEAAGLSSRQFPSLSGGERARVALARVLAQRTQLLLLDEPTAALDLHHQELVLQLVRARTARGDGAVVVLHALELAGAYADRVVVIAAGRVAADGPPREVLTSSLLSAVYQHEVEVLPHPYSGGPLVLPLRR
jgi:iron complex transport system ATP-binding protein